jgi:hypothetical protein
MLSLGRSTELSYQVRLGKDAFPLEPCEAQVGFQPYLSPQVKPACLFMVALIPEKVR